MITLKRSVLLGILISLCLSLNAQLSTLQDKVNRKQYKAAIQYADSLTSADSTYQVMSALGQAYEGLLRYREAYNYYQYCLGTDTSNIDMLNTVARTALNLGRGKDAERFFSKVLETDSLNFYANYQLGRLYQQLGEYDNAIEKYYYLLEQDEDNSALQKNIGDCYARMEDWASAASSYYFAFDNNRENAALASAAVNSLLRVGGPFIDEALAVCDTALLYSPDSRLLRQNKALILYMCKRYTEADTLYSSLMAEGDSTYLTIKYGGASKYYAGLYLPSVDILEIAYEMDTTAVDVCLLYGSAIGKTYDRKRAYDLFDKAELGMQPNPFLVNQLMLFRAETLQKDGRYKEATELYYQAWQKNPTRTDILMNMAIMNGGTDIHAYKSANERQRGLFCQILFLTKYIENGGDVKDFHSYRKFMESLYEDMFFRNITKEPMLSPDGKKCMLSIHDVRSLMNRLPEGTGREE